jgi:hypothetical protein
MRGHPGFDWTVEVDKPADQQWRLKLRGVLGPGVLGALGKNYGKPTTWDIYLRPSSVSNRALVAYAGQFDGQVVDVGQLSLALYCSAQAPLRRP